MREPAYRGTADRIREAVVLAGGFGTRLAHVVPDVCKPMAPVAGEPFLRRVLCLLYTSPSPRDRG